LHIIRQHFFILIALIYIGVFITDLLAYKGFRLLIKRKIRGSKRKIWLLSYWVFTGIVYVAIFIELTIEKGYSSPSFYPLFFYTIALVFTLTITKICFIVFNLADDIIHLAGKIFTTKKRKERKDNPNAISRSAFLTKTGTIVSGIPFIAFTYGVLKGRFDFRVCKEDIYFKRLPQQFNGLRIVQISDIHIGSFFNNTEDINRAIDMANDLNADLLFFTGDMVNNLAEEVLGWEEIIGRLHAKIGKYAVLGNHDYGDYSEWKSPKDKQNNLEALKKAIEKMGFRLLLNEWVGVEKDGVSLSIIGVENWGKGRFSKHGDLVKATKSVPPGSFKILLSHDPSQWDAKVLVKTDIDLTFSGHTHGFQFGIETPFLKWSPAQYTYPRWAGLYREGLQYLYVNRGLGYIGFPGRVGMPPEITCINLLCET